MPTNDRTVDLKFHRIPAYVARLPPCSTVLIIATVIASVVDALSVFDVQGFGALIPDKISIFSGKLSPQSTSCYLAVVSE